MGLVVKYLRGLRVVLLLHSLGASIDGVHIGRSLGWNVEIYGVLWSHSLALRPALLVGLDCCSSIVLRAGSIVQSTARA